MLDAAAIPFNGRRFVREHSARSPRTTFDLDIVIDPTSEALDRFLAAIDLDRFYVDPDVARDAFKHRTMFNVIDMNTAFKIHLLIQKDRAFSIEEIGRRSPARS